jgi:hypothetical protein
MFPLWKKGLRWFVLLFIPLYNPLIFMNLHVGFQDFFFRRGPIGSTSSLRQWCFRQCLLFSWTTLRGKHCRHPIAVMGVVDTFELNLTDEFNFQHKKSSESFYIKYLNIKIVNDNFRNTFPTFLTMYSVPENLIKKFPVDPSPQNSTPEGTLVFP